MVICLRMFLSIIHFLITHSEFFFLRTHLVPWQVVLFYVTGILTLSWGFFYKLYIPSALNMQCNFTPNTYLLVYHCSSVQVTVQILFPFLKVTLPQQRKNYCRYCFSFTLFFSQQCGQNQLLQGASSLSLFHGLVIETGALSSFLFPAWPIFVLHWLSPLEVLFLQPWVDIWDETVHATMKMCSVLKLH